MAKVADGASAQAEAASPPLEPLEESLKFIDFKMERMGPDCVEGRFVVSKKSCQPFGVLHGGVSALIAEALASTGAFFASGHHHVAGVQLTINHVKSAPIGTEILASAKPIHVGQRTHVWDVILSKVHKVAGLATSDNSQGTRVALARVTLMVDPSGPVVNVDKQGRPLARL